MYMYIMYTDIGSTQILRFSYDYEVIPQPCTDVLLQEVVPRFLGVSHTLEMMLTRDPKAYETLYEGVVAYSAALAPCGASLDTMDEEHKVTLFEMVSIWV